MTYFVLTRLPIAGGVQAALYVITILIGVNLSTFLGLYWFMHRSLRLSVSWTSMGKYVLAAVLMAVVLFLVPTTTTLLSTLAKAIAGFALYILVLLAIDKQARKLVGLVWEEVKGTITQLKSKDNSN